MLPGFVSAFVFLSKIADFSKKAASFITPYF